jgi:hypothetical protein
VIAVVFAASCAKRPAAPAPNDGGAVPPVARPPAEDLFAPRGEIELHWKDAADSTRLLRAPHDAKLRITATITGADSLRGFTLLFRLHPASPESTTAWTFRPRPGCDAAMFAITAEKDPKAPAPWFRKLLLTDKVESPDGDRLFFVIAAYDDVIVDPDSTYSLCHLDLEPAPAGEDGRQCGWDVPMQVSLDVAKVSLFGRDVPAKDFGHGLTFEPILP